MGYYFPAYCAGGRRVRLWRTSGNGGVGREGMLYSVPNFVYRGGDIRPESSNGLGRRLVVLVI